MRVGEGEGPPAPALPLPRLLSPPCSGSFEDHPQPTFHSSSLPFSPNLQLLLAKPGTRTPALCQAQSQQL